MTSALTSLLQTSAPLLGVTVLWHPVAARIGEQFIGQGGGVIEVSRFLPLFRKLGGDGLPLGERSLTRDPLLLRLDAADGVEITVPHTRMVVELNGRSITGRAYVSRAQIDAGVVLGLGGTILLCLHWMRTLPKANAMRGLLGVSSAAIKMRDQIHQVAATDLAVLLLGETGTGKEIAARAIHSAGKRANAPLVSVNMAALNEALAAADLFGAVKGAYTGAQHAREGLFAEAAGGTLFLDEIGDTPATIQPMLLRVLESGEYRPLGARANLHSTARLIAATDQDLEKKAFNQPLLRRLEAFVIRVPALRERREDIGLLIVHFLNEWELEEGGGSKLSVSLVSQLCQYDWPGNIRQLANVVRRVCIGLRAGDMPSFDMLVRAPGARPHPSAEPARETKAAPAAVSPAPQRTRLSDLSNQAVIDAMEHHAWQIQGAAQELGISRPSLYKLLEAHPEIRRVEAIPAEEIRAALKAHRGDLSRCASALKTPSEALRRHLRMAVAAG
ncbi:DNA-binding NtrC family response regulator [Oxalobacteraceae bacterium GrIS 1.11]